MALPILILLCAAAAEIACRLFWHYRYSVPLLKPERILYVYYPELVVVDERCPTRGDEFYDVLLLGGSVLHPGWGDVEEVLTRRLLSHGYKQSRIYNLAVPAHTSRDSLIKYAALDNARFDLVVFYHGLNEVRANNVPPELYRDNYDHYSWYESANELSANHSKATFALSYTVHHLWIRLHQIVHSHEYVPTHKPREGWVQYGQNPLSVVSFKQNVEAIVDIAESRGDPLLLLTFSIHLPKNYSLERFRKKELDYGYGLYLTPVELWGDPGHVGTTVARQNDVLRHEAAEHESVLFIDMAARIPRNGRYFNDPCHLTTSGSELFADNLFPVISRFPRGHGEHPAPVAGTS